ncbi:hypothetical protein ACU4GD_09390 [Cupriavidus basilensis]
MDSAVLDANTYSADINGSQSVTWQPEIDELDYRRRLAARMGGEEQA